MIAMYFSDFLFGTCKMAFGLFCLWMFCVNVYAETDPKERLIWTFLILLLGPIFAPLYYLRNHLPRQRRNASQLEQT